MKSDGKGISQLVTLGISELDLQKKIETRNGEFVIKALFPYEKTYVIKLIAEQAGNISNLFIAEAEYVRKICTLQVCIVENPDWWVGASNCLDDDLLNHIYEEYLKLEDSLSEKLKKNRPN